METVADTGLTVEQLAASTSRAFRWAMQEEPGSWGLLPEAARQMWLALAAQMANGGADLEGQSFKALAERLYKATAQPGDEWSELFPATKIAWEAAIRHLATLCEDEIDDLPALEQSWREWATKRLQPVETK